MDANMVEATKNTTMAVADYIDQYGRQWPFLCHANGDDERRQKCRDNWLWDNGSKQAKLKGQYNYYQCRLNGWHFQRRVQPPPPKCPARAIFVKETGNFYISTDGHNHSLEKKRMALPKTDTDDYIDRLGKLWKFCSHVGTETVKGTGPQAYEYCRQRGLYVTGTGQNLNAIHFRCYKCKNFKAIFLRKNGCLYTRGEHDHAVKLNTNAPKGKKQRNVESRRERQTSEKRKEPTKLPRNPLMKFLEAPPNVGKDFVEAGRLKRRWHFFVKLNSDKHNEFRSARRRLWLSTVREVDSEFGGKKVYFRCKTKTKLGNQGGLACQFDALLLRDNNCLYVRNEHNHPLGTVDDDEEKDAEESNVGNGNERENVLSSSCYIDEKGKKWNLYANLCSNNEAADEEEDDEEYEDEAKKLMDLCHKLGLYKLHRGRKNPVEYFGCINERQYKRKNGTNGKSLCKFRAIFLHENGCFYIRNKHSNHHKKMVMTSDSESYSDDEEMTTANEGKHNMEEDSGGEQEEATIDASDNDDENKQMNGVDDNCHREDVTIDASYDDDDEHLIEDDDNGQQEKAEQQQQQGLAVENQAPILPPSGDWEIVDEVNRDYKMLPKMKRENEVRPTEWPTITIEDPDAHINLLFHNYRQKLLRIKKEEQMDESDMPSTSAAVATVVQNVAGANVQHRPAAPVFQQPATPTGPKRMLLRERKPVNYRE